MSMEYITRIKVRIEVQTSKRGEVLEVELDTLEEIIETAEDFVRERFGRD